MVRTHYDPQSSMRAARARYFALNRFGADGGYGERWMSLKLGPLPLALPNLGERVRAVRYHDLHHVLTGYHTDIVGEFEIAAWELSAGCRDYWVAWIFNLSALSAGSVVAPTRTFRAFVSGRACRSLYGEDLERLLSSTVGHLRDETGLEEAEFARPRLLDRLAYLGLSLLGFSVGAGLLVLALPLTPFGMLWFALRGAKATAASASPR